MTSSINTIIKEIIKHLPGKHNQRSHAHASRKDPELREYISSLSPVDKLAALNILRASTGQVDSSQVHELTGFKTKAPWQEGLANNTLKPVIVHADVAGLGWVNDNLGHDAGDALLKAMASVVRDSKLEDSVYHISGDEFNFEFDDPEQAEEIMQKVVHKLNRLSFTAVNADNKEVKFRGATFTYGIGHNKNSREADRLAELGLIDAKREAVGFGIRPKTKGDKPRDLIAEVEKNLVGHRNGK